MSLSDAMSADPVCQAAKKAAESMKAVGSIATEQALAIEREAIRNFAIIFARGVAGQLSPEAVTAVSQLIAAGLLYEQSGAQPMTFVEFTSSVLGLTPEQTAATAQLLRQFIIAISAISVLKEADTPCQH
jgi:hypothetical protein